MKSGEEYCIYFTIMFLIRLYKRLFKNSSNGGLFLKADVFDNIVNSILIYHYFKTSLRVYTSQQISVHRFNNHMSKTVVKALHTQRK